MKTYIERTFTDKVKITDTITCDVCGKKYFERKEDGNANHDDAIEIQEFHCIDFVGGYGSVFGDGNRIKCDICQHCLKKLLGEYLKRSTEMCPWNE
jgi:hypothetical protein